MLRKGELVYLDRVEADWPLRLHLPAGTALPPHCSASGKLLLAFKAPAEREQFVSTLPLPRFTERTITNRQLLASELDRIAATGYAVDNEEYVIGVACVAVPVRDAAGEVVAAVAVHAATARLPLTRAIEFVPQLNDAATRISATFA
jgi:DNA-binding IclR family transcriptional regulator